MSHRCVWILTEKGPENPLHPGPPKSAKQPPFQPPSAKREDGKLDKRWQGRWSWQFLKKRDNQGSLKRSWEYLPLQWRIYHCMNPPTVGHRPGGFHQPGGTRIKFLDWSQKKINKSISLKGNQIGKQTSFYTKRLYIYVARRLNDKQCVTLLHNAATYIFVSLCLTQICNTCICTMINVCHHLGVIIVCCTQTQNAL